MNVVRFRLFFRFSIISSSTVESTLFLDIECFRPIVLKQIPLVRYRGVPIGGVGVSCPRNVYETSRKLVIQHRLKRV